MDTDKELVNMALLDAAADETGSAILPGIGIRYIDLQGEPRYALYRSSIDPPDHYSHTDNMCIKIVKRQPS